MKLLFVLLCAACLSGCDMHEPVGVVLIYEIDPEPDVSGAKVPFDEVVTAVRRRLRSVAQVETTEGQKIKVINFDADGAKRFGRLTSNNLPDEVDQRLAHRLAIILDGRVHSAPFIRSRIDDQAQISGNFTEQEAARLADILVAGELPVAVQKVGESAPAP